LSGPQGSGGESPPPPRGSPTSHLPATIT